MLETIYGREYLVLKGGIYRCVLSPVALTIEPEDDYEIEICTIKNRISLHC